MLCVTLPLPLFDTTRLGVIMEPRPGDPHEVEGVLNPAGVVGPDGEYYLFPRLVGAHNYSRIGTARVIRDGDGRPVDVERLPHALEPAAPYEIVRPGVGGCEDPRVTYVAALELYVLAYTALGPTGPHVALASSRDLRHWRRHGLVDFATEDGVTFNRYSNKDAILLSEPVKAPDGRRAYALLHRPMYEAWPGEDGIENVPMRLPRGVHDDRPSMWISYCPVEEADWSGEAPPRQKRVGSLPHRRRDGAHAHPRWPADLLPRRGVVRRRRPVLPRGGHGARRGRSAPGAEPLRDAGLRSRDRR